MCGFTPTGTDQNRPDDGFTGVSCMLRYVCTHVHAHVMPMSIHVSIHVFIHMPIHMSIHINKLGPRAWASRLPVMAPTLLCHRLSVALTRLHARLHARPPARPLAGYLLARPPASTHTNAHVCTPAHPPICTDYMHPRHATPHHNIPR